MKASIAAALQSDAVNRGNTSKCRKYFSVEHTHHAWRSPIAFLQATSMLCALHSGEAERGHVGDSKPCLSDDWGSGLFISEKHFVGAKASRVYARLQSGGNLKLYFVGQLRAAPNGQCAPAGSRPDCPLTVSSTVGMLIPLSGNWVPAWSVRVLKSTDEESQDASPSSVICQTVKVALKGFEDFNIELIALVQNAEFPSPKMMTTQWNSHVRRSSTSTLAREDSTLQGCELRAAKHLLRLDAVRLSRLTYFVAGKCESVAPRSCLSFIPLLF